MSDGLLNKSVTLSCPCEQEVGRKKYTIFFYKYGDEEGDNFLILKLRGKSHCIAKRKNPKNRSSSDKRAYDLNENFLLSYKSKKFMVFPS